MILNLLGGLLGVIFMTLVMMNNRKREFEVAGQPFKIKRFFEDEFIGICSSIVFLIIMWLTVNEWMYINKTVESYVTCLFVVGGAIGSWAFQYFLGRSKKYIQRVIDIKTNIVDNELGKSATIGELTKKAENAGKDITPPIP